MTFLTCGVLVLGYRIVLKVRCSRLRVDKDTFGEGSDHAAFRVA